MALILCRSTTSRSIPKSAVSWEAYPRLSPEIYAATNKWLSRRWLTGGTEFTSRVSQSSFSFIFQYDTGWSKFSPFQMHLLFSFHSSWISFKITSRSKWRQPFDLDSCECRSAVWLGQLFYAPGRSAVFTLCPSCLFVLRFDLSVAPLSLKTTSCFWFSHLCLQMPTHMVCVWNVAVRLFLIQENVSACPWLFSELIRLAMFSISS